MEIISEENSLKGKGFMRMRRCYLMPYPEIISPKEEEASSQGARILYFPIAARVQALAATRERIWAHAIDIVFVHGFSLYAAKWLAVIMTNFYSQYFHGSAKMRENFYIDTVNYAMPKVWFASFCVFSLLYIVCTHHWWGRSLGKALMGLRVVDDNGVKPSVVSCLRRYFAYWVTYFSFGAGFWFYSVHEKLTHTRVIKEK